MDTTDMRLSPGAAAAVTALYAQHALGLVRLAVVMTGERAAAEDIVQDAFLGLYRRWDRVSAVAAPLAYLRVSVVNGCRTATDAKGNKHNGILAGETGTGKTHKTFPSPAHTVFASVTAAADDRTFVVFAVTGDTRAQKGTTATGIWYAVRLVPGSADPARMTRLPIEPEIAFPGAGPESGFSSVLSGSGRELAVIDGATAPFAVKVYSVATGRLLHDCPLNLPAGVIATTVAGIAF